LYGDTFGSSRSVQSASVKTRYDVSIREPAIAAADDVITTRRTSARRAASSTRNAPSRAGPISSFGSFGCSTGSGDARWTTSVQPAAADVHASGSFRSATTTSTSSPPSTNPPSAARTAGIRCGPLTVARTR